MTLTTFEKIWPVLKREVKKLRLPWLDQMAASDRDPFKVLISCLLSLRTKDQVTAEASQRLFRIAQSPETLAGIPAGRIEKAIYPVGFYRVKAERIRAISRRISEEYGGKVPDTIDALLTLEGVGRKTANLVVTQGYNRPGICVDTHVHRIPNRWGLVKTKTPLQTEMALREILPIRYWKELNGHLVAYGQGICKPVSPLCSQCKINPACAKIGVTHHR